MQPEALIVGDGATNGVTTFVSVSKLATQGEEYSEYRIVLLSRGDLTALAPPAFGEIAEFEVVIALVRTPVTGL